MHLPIQYALTYPQRLPLEGRRLDFCELGTLEFRRPDTDRFPNLALAYECLRRGGHAGAVLNAANEIGVAAFLDGKIRFADIARKSLEDKLAAGRPLSGRNAARVLRDVIRIKTTEDQARLESRLINVRDQFQKLCAPHADGSPSDLETQIAARRQRFGLPPATAEQFQVYRDTALRDLEARARRADHSLTPAESLDALGESARMLTLREAKAGIAAMAEQVSGEGPHGFMARLDAAMRTKGLDGAISPATRDVLVQTIHDKLVARCLNDSNNMHQPTLAEATTAAENVINNFVAALDTVEHARAMPREAKRILQDEILHSPKPVNAAMAQAICDAVLDTGRFLRTLTLAEATPAGLKRDFDA